MCGIIGYVGHDDAQDILLNGLEQLEYRGYDSAGIAVVDAKKRIRIRKKVGKVAFLKEYCSNSPLPGNCGIGHTRWATHGGVTNENAHPHRAGYVALIHNGIIENYHDISRMFDLEGTLVSQTDTEVAAALLNHMYEETGHDAFDAIRRTVEIIRGSYAFCIIFSDQPDRIYCVRNVSPLVAASCEKGSFIASDLTALIPYSREYMLVPENHILVLTKDGITTYNMDMEVVTPKLETVSWSVESAQKGGYPHFMIKEIHEQPEAIRRTITPRIKDGLPDFSDDGIPNDIFENVQELRVVACGTAMHAGMVFKSLAEAKLRIPVIVTIASEYRYENPIIKPGTLVIVISQSGETIDTLEALRISKANGAKTLGVVNVKGSTIARESDYVLYTHAGPEIAVASTKAYTVQLAALYLITCKMGLLSGRFTEEQGRAFIAGMQQIPELIEKMVLQSGMIKEVSREFHGATDTFFIGRGQDYTLSLEGALKLKEISYIHAEAYAAGELKHGTIALITDYVPVIAVATQENILSKTLSNIREVKARGAYVILVGSHLADMDCSVADVKIELPECTDIFAVFPAVTVLQLLAYYVAVAKDLDVDKPRNLAKSVTVE